MYNVYDDEYCKKFDLFNVYKQMEKIHILKKKSHKTLYEFFCCRLQWKLLYHCQNLGQMKFSTILIDQLYTICIFNVTYMYSWYNVQYMSCNFKPLFGKRNFLVPYVIQIHFLKINRGMKLHRFSCLHFNKQHPMHAFIVRPNENLLYFHWIYIYIHDISSQGANLMMVAFF